MEIALLSGAYKNAGDYLIEKRAKSLLEHFIPNIHCNRFLRSEINEKLDKINEMDVIVFTGGPIYMNNIDGYLPLDRCIREMKPKIMIMGGGWYGRGSGTARTYAYDFTSKTKEFLKMIDSNGYGLSCRDLYSVKILKKAGMENVKMTGCPAWYYLPKVFQKNIENSEWNIKKITVSDPALERNFPLALQLIRYLKSVFSNAEILFLFHRGIGQDRYTNAKSAEWRQKFVNELTNGGVNIKDISYSCKGFTLYDGCDLHIGFRVHAHLYNLSMRQRSILIEEDGRGTGADEVLGLPSIKAYNDEIQISNRYADKIGRILLKETNSYLIEEVDNYLQVLCDTKDQYLINAYQLQEKYFENMREYVSQINGR